MRETCDRCGPYVEARFRYKRDGDQPWHWCAHYAKRYDAGLTSQGWQRYALVKAGASV